MVNSHTIVCPFCDEPAHIIPNAKIYTPGKIYTKRRCMMGHEMYSVEEIPENQARVMDEIEKIRAYRKEQRIKAMRKKRKK